MWQKLYAWLVYDEIKESIVCGTCTEADQRKLPLPTDRPSMVSRKAFIEEGFRTFKNAPGAFAPHENSHLHRAAVLQILTSKNQSIIEHLSTAKKKEMLDNRVALSKIFSSVQFLGRQGLAFRGHEDKTSNVYQWLRVRSQDVPELKSWMNRDGHKWLHHQIIDEIISLFAAKIRNKILLEIKSSKYYALMIDETSDIAKLEQVSICLRVVKEDLLISEYFMEFQAVQNTKSETLKNLVLQFLGKQTLDIHDMRGQCYDGASNVSGRITGLQTLIRQIESRAMFVHCSTHCVSLSV